MSFPVIFGRASEEPLCGRFILLVENRFCSIAGRERTTTTRHSPGWDGETRFRSLLNVIIDRIDIKGNDRPGSRGGTVRDRNPHRIYRSEATGDGALRWPRCSRRRLYLKLENDYPMALELSDDYLDT